MSQLNITFEIGRKQSHMVQYICDDCGKPIVKPMNSCGTGYAIYDDKHICYNCSGLRIRVDMITTGRAILYIPGKDTRYFRYVTDWPGVLKFEINRRTMNLCPTPNGSKYQRIDV